MVALETATQVLLVTQLDLPCLRNVVRLMMSFGEINGLKDKVKIVVNRVGLDAGQISTGGTIHLVMNNQIGFTTNPREARTTPYSTDIARGGPGAYFSRERRRVHRPLPRRTDWPSITASTSRRDVVIDVIGYRRHGHNEGGRSQLHAAGPLSQNQGALPPLLRCTAIGWCAKKCVRGTGREVQAMHPGFSHGSTRPLTRREEGRSATILRSSRGPSEQVSATLPAHRGQCQAALTTWSSAALRLPGRVSSSSQAATFSTAGGNVRQGRHIDWAFAETLAFGSLVLEGTPFV